MTRARHLRSRSRLMGAFGAALLPSLDRSAGDQHPSSVKRQGVAVKSHQRRTKYEVRDPCA